jgi:hypothetical protein
MSATAPITPIDMKADMPCRFGPKVWLINIKKDSDDGDAVPVYVVPGKWIAKAAVDNRTIFVYNSEVDTEGVPWERLDCGDLLTYGLAAVSIMDDSVGAGAGIACKNLFTRVRVHEEAALSLSEIAPGLMLINAGYDGAPLTRMLDSAGFVVGIESRPRASYSQWVHTVVYIKEIRQRDSGGLRAAAIWIQVGDG